MLFFPFSASDKAPDYYAERSQSLGQQMLERWAKIGCENATVGKNGLTGSPDVNQTALKSLKKSEKKFHGYFGTILII